MLNITDLSEKQLRNLKDKINKQLGVLNQQKLIANNVSTDSDRVIASMDFASYKKHRYGKPWIAKILKWRTGSAPELGFGVFYGNCYSGGYCEIDVCVGDIVRWGQKDYSGIFTIVKWGEVCEYGKIKSLPANKAKDRYKQQQMRKRKTR